MKDVQHWLQMLSVNDWYVHQLYETWPDLSMYIEVQFGHTSPAHAQRCHQSQHILFFVAETEALPSRTNRSCSARCQKQLTTLHQSTQVQTNAITQLISSFCRTQSVFSRVVSGGLSAHKTFWSRPILTWSKPTFQGHNLKFLIG